MYLQSRSAVADESVKAVPCVCLLLYCRYQHSGCHQFGCPDVVLLFSLHFSFYSPNVSQYRSTVSVAIALVSTLLTLYGALAMQSQSLKNLTMFSIVRSHEIDIRCWILDVQSSSFHCLQHRFTLPILCWNSFWYISHRSSSIVWYYEDCSADVQDDLWFVPSFSDSMNQLLL